MKTIKIGEKEYKIQFGYIATAKSGIIRDLVNIERMIGDGESAIENLDKILMFIPEIMLVGLQKFHREEFGYNYDTKEGKDEAFEKVSQLVDDYFDGEDADFKGLFNSLEDELLHNGFLSSMFHEEQESQNKEQKKAQSRAKKSAAEN